MRTVKEARKTMVQAFKKDPDFRRVYVDKVSSFIMDRIPGYKRSKTKRDFLADEIIYIIFET